MEDTQMVIDSFKELKPLLCSLLEKNNFEGLGKKDKEELSEHFDIAIEALEKQIPKKPIMESWSPAKCPSCGIELSESIGDGYYKHYYRQTICECGQKLKWHDED